MSIVFSHFSVFLFFYFLPEFVPFSIYLCTYPLPLVRAAVCSRGIVGLCCCGDASSYASCSISWCQQHGGPSTMKTASSPTQRLRRRKLSECDCFGFALFACVWQAKREILINQKQKESLSMSFARCCLLTLWLQVCSFFFFGPTRNHELHFFSWAFPWWPCRNRKWPHSSPAVWLDDRTRWVEAGPHCTLNERTSLSLWESWRNSSFMAG